jgi:hypothetical protein
MIKMFQTGLSVAYGMHNGSRRNKVSARTRFTPNVQDVSMSPPAVPHASAATAKKSAPRKRKQRAIGEGEIDCRTPAPAAKKPAKDKKYPNEPAKRVVVKKKEKVT